LVGDGGQKPGARRRVEVVQFGEVTPRLEDSLLHGVLGFLAVAQHGDGEREAGLHQRLD